MDDEMEIAQKQRGRLENSKNVTDLYKKGEIIQLRQEKGEAKKGWKFRINQRGWGGGGGLKKGI